MPFQESNTRTKSSCCCCCCLTRYCVFKYLFRSVAPVTRKPHALHARRHRELFLFQKKHQRGGSRGTVRYTHGAWVEHRGMHASPCTRRLLSGTPVSFPLAACATTQTARAHLWLCSLRSDWLHAERASARARSTLQFFSRSIKTSHRCLPGEKKTTTDGVVCGEGGR